jgi:hypothetical protein
MGWIVVYVKCCGWRKRQMGEEAGSHAAKVGAGLLHAILRYQNYVETNSKLAQKEISHPAPVFDGKSREAEN